MDALIPISMLHPSWMSERARYWACMLGIVFGPIFLGGLTGQTARSQALIHALSSPNEQEFGRFSQAVAGLSDINGDGVPELLVGASGEGSGRAYVFSGASGALLHTLDSPNPEGDGSFGWSVSGVPDADGDATDDLLIGAFFEDPDSSPSNAGRAYLFSGATGILLHTLTSPNQEVFGRFGDAVAGVPDLDGDSRGDLLVGAPGEGLGGRAYVFSGASGALRRSFTAPSFDPTDSVFGGAVAGLPDLDGDGRGDLVIGASGERLEGRVYVYSGATGAELYALDNPGTRGGAFGGAVSVVPDADGDEVVDLVVGAENDEAGGMGLTNSGRAYLFSGASGALVRRLVSPNEEQEGEFGFAVAGVADVDGDGRGDLLVGAYYENPGGSIGNAGRAYVFSGASGVLLHTLASPNEVENGQFGWSVAGVMDLDDDGRGDLLVGALFEESATSTLRTGRAYVFSGASEAPLSLDAAALNSPVPRGGRLRVRVTLTNHTASALTGSLYVRVVAPGGQHLTRALVTGATLGAGQTVRPVFALPVPDAAPLGSYTGRVAAVAGGSVVAVASFPFEVVASAGAVGEEGEERWGPVALIEAGGLLASPLTEEAGAGEAVEAVAVPSAVPNPASGRAVVGFVLAEAAEVQLELYDVLGREVASVSRRLQAGPQRMAVDVSGLPAGVYVWQLAAEGRATARVETGRLTVVR
jgi:hypothetical protein